MGKGAGIVHGWEESKNEHIITVDADLANLQNHHLDRIISAYFNRNLDMVVAVRDRILLWGWLSGERIYRKSTVIPYTRLAINSGNGIEQVINHAHRGLKVETVVSENIGHIVKYKRGKVHESVIPYLQEGWQLLKTEIVLRRHGKKSRLR